MSFTDTHLRRIKCDAPGCDKDVEFDLKDVKKIQAIEWLKGVRVIQTGDNRNLSYCSDVCEVKGVTTANHNVKEPPKVQPATGAVDVQQAVQRAAAESEANKALHDGDKKITLS